MHRLNLRHESSRIYTNYNDAGFTKFVTIPPLVSSFQIASLRRTSNTLGGTFRSAACLRFFLGRRDREVNLPFKEVNTRNKHRQFVADLKPFARSSANELTPSGFKHIEVICER